MAQRIVYKDGKEFACDLNQARKMVATEGWSWTNSAPDKPSKKTTAKAKKAKIKAEAVVQTGSIFDDGEPINIDLGTIEQSKENE
jgi:hypothetical protein